MELHERITELGEANKELLLRYNWEWFCSLNLQGGSDCQVAERKLKEWRVKTGIENHIRVAYMGAFNTINNPHIHLLALGRNRFGQTLMNLSPKDWEAAWSGLTKCQAVIEPIYEREGVARYIAKKNLPWDRSELIQPYNKRLLAKAMMN
jgi:hypothetical protein